VQFVSEKPTIEIAEPKTFGVLSILVKYAFSFLLCLPFAGFLLLLSLHYLGRWTLGLGLLVLVITICLTPSLGNLYVFWAVRRLKPSAQGAKDSLIVQVTLCPRVRHGFRALIEDADDVGYLALEKSALVFYGDSLRLTVPFERIKAVEGENVGLRGVYVASGRIVIEVAGLEGVESVEIAERSSRLIFSSRKLTRAVFAQLKEKVQASETR
jgi:hypothetical protein